MKLSKKYPVETLDKMAELIGPGCFTKIAEAEGCSSAYVGKVFKGDVEINELVLKIIARANKIIRETEKEVEVLLKKTDELLES